MKTYGYSRVERHRRQKKPLYTKWWLWLIVALVIVSLGFSGFKLYSSHHWSAPYYDQTGSHVLIDKKNNNLNDDQRKKFYAIAHSAVKSEYPKLYFDNLSDTGIYVKKLNAPQTYQIDYFCKTDFALKMKFHTRLNIKLKNKSSKGKTPFTYSHFQSNLDVFSSANKK